MKEVNFERADAFAWGDGDVTFNTAEETVAILAEIDAREAAQAKQRQAVLDSLNAPMPAAMVAVSRRLGFGGLVKLGKPEAFGGNTIPKFADDAIHVMPMLESSEVAYVLQAYNPTSR